MSRGLSVSVCAFLGFFLGRFVSWSEEWMSRKTMACQPTLAVGLRVSTAELTWANMPAFCFFVLVPLCFALLEYCLLVCMALVKGYCLLACWVASLAGLLRLLAELLACWLACLLACLLAGLLACWLACFLACLLARMLACSLARWLACVLACVSWC